MEDQEYIRLRDETERARDAYEAYYKRRGRPSERLGKKWDYWTNLFFAYVEARGRRERGEGEQHENTGA